ncbi:hypothetical protein B6J52_13135 [Klebsiella pneumoniae]|nr:hypothetical protein B6J52_13135 [Klebsiella pneumoniae]
MRSLLSPAKSSSLPFMMKLSGFVRRQDFVPACSCGENQTCVGLARAGLGVVFVSGRTEDIPSEGLEFVEIAAPVPELEIAVVWRTRDPSVLLQPFRELAEITIENGSID